MSLWLLWWPPTGSSMFMVVVILLMYSVLHCLYSVGNKITTTTYPTAVQVDFYEVVLSIIYNLHCEMQNFSGEQIVSGMSRGNHIENRELWTWQFCCHWRWCRLWLWQSQVIMTTYGAAIDNKVGLITTLGFQSRCKFCVYSHCQVCSCRCSSFNNLLLQKLQVWPLTYLTHLPPGQNGRLFADVIFRCIFINESFVFLIKFHWSLLLRFQLPKTQHWFR